jgi:putative endonuclease
MAGDFKARVLGQEAEDRACDYLQRHGLKLIQKNFSCPCGEIDLIMQDGDEVVFIEVRLRHHSYMGNALESVTAQKQKRLLKTALLYLQKKKWLDRVNCRFDVVGMDSARNIEWVKNAFGLGFV